MRKKILFIIFVMLLAVTSGCTSDNDIKVYENTEEIDISHVEQTFTAVITDIDLENNNIGFLDCINGDEYELIYHGGVSVTNTYGDEIGIDGIANGSVVDVVYYSDTNKLVSIAQNSSATILKKVNKFSVDMQSLKAKYKGTSCQVSELAVAFDGGEPISIMEVNTEDQVTLNMYGGKLVSVVVDIGHGYVRLQNQDSYIGGMVEIGYDVIVPVTSDMLLAVREGKYTLRINKGSYSESKQVEVIKNKESIVDLSDIAIPTGMVTFDITPSGSEIYINGDKIEGYTYSGLYGSYSIKITAEGYQTFSGSFRISEPVRTFTVNMTKLDDGDDDKTETSTESTTGTGGTTQGTDSTGASDTGTDSTETGTDTGTDGSTNDSTETTSSDSKEDSSESTAETGEKTDNTITVKAPAGVGVYLDGDYVGVTPVTFPKVAGTHTITLYKTGYLIKSYTIQAVDNGEDDEYSFAALVSLFDIVE